MILFIWFFAGFSYVGEAQADCSRSYSRVVRNVFIQNIEPEFSRLKLDIPEDCPFSIARDLYGLQEHYKKMETVGHWTCRFCGKAFYDEMYLDKHFDRRHSNKLPQDSSRAVCLADFCDVFRCDIITGRVVPQYWDKALCKESELSELMDKCQHILSSCVPKGLDPDVQGKLVGFMNSTVCSYLTCASFWDSLENEVSPAYTALYITAAVFFLFGSLIYYFVAYSHFYTDESLLDGSHRQSRSVRSSRVNKEGNVRYRPSNAKSVW